MPAQSGALARLAGALAFRSAFVDGPGGRLAAARAAESEAHELAEATDNPAVVPPTGAHTLPILVLSGREAEARATAAAVAREAPGRGAAGEAAFAAYCLGVLEISLGNYGSAVGAWIRRTPTTRRSSGPRHCPTWWRPPSAPVGATWQNARSSAWRPRDRHRHAPRPRAARPLPGPAGRARPRPGRSTRTRSSCLGRTQAAPQLARAHLLYGEWLRRQRRRREARDQLRTAHDMFDAMGLALLRRAGSVSSCGPPASAPGSGRSVSPEELTPQEAQIAALVSRGEANREIAAQLFVSPSTVEYHLRKVFRKLGVTSRTQLAHRVISQGSGALHRCPPPSLRSSTDAADPPPATERRRRSPEPRTGRPAATSDPRTEDFGDSAVPAAP